MIRRRATVLAVLTLLLAALTVFNTPVAAQTNYGTFLGSTVIYQDVTEYSGTDPGQYFMKSPQVLGDTLDFNPTFTANAANGTSIIKDAQINFDLVAKAGYGIEGLLFTEGGDYTLSGSGGTASTLADVSAEFIIEILEVDNVVINPITLQPSMLFSPNPSGTFTCPPFVSGPWSGSLAVDFDAVLTAANFSYTLGATKVAVVFDNTLTAQSEPNSRAFIAKKDTKGLSITVIPEPTTFALALLGLGGLGLFTFRRTHKH